MKIFHMPFVLAWELCEEVNAQFDIGLTPDDFYKNLSFPIVSETEKLTYALVDIYDHDSTAVEGCIRTVLEDLIPYEQGHGYICVVLPLTAREGD